MAVVNIYTDDKTAQEWRAAAAGLMMNVSEMVRDAMEDYLMEQHQEKLVAKKEGFIRVKKDKLQALLADIISLKMNAEEAIPND